MNMKRFLILAVVVLSMLATACSKYKYETVKGDPMKTRIYTLPNGLKVYMSVNKEAPRLQTAIAVKVGGKELDDGECVCVPPDGEVDTDELFAGILLPLFPSRFLCSEDCRGLCPVCGRDLNTGSCGCGTRPVDPRLEKLRALLEEDKK